MLEKSGTISLTSQDLEELREGKVSERVKATWGLTLVELQEVVKNNDYVTFS